MPKCFTKSMEIVLIQIRRTVSSILFQFLFMQLNFLPQIPKEMRPAIFYKCIFFTNTNTKYKQKYKYNEDVKRIFSKCLFGNVLFENSLYHHPHHHNHIEEIRWRREGAHIVFFAWLFFAAHRIPICFSTSRSTGRLFARVTTQMSKHLPCLSLM